MASRENDRLVTRTVEGSVNTYCNGKVKCTAADRALASRMSGHSYNIVTNSDAHETYFRDLRSQDHVVDHAGRHTADLFGSRRRKFAADERGTMARTLEHPDAHPRECLRAQQRMETQLAQVENSQSYAGFQQRRAEFAGPPPSKKYQVHNARYANEAEKLRPKLTSRSDWQQRRGETMSHSWSAPSLSIADPAASLSRAVRDDIRKEASQRQLETAHVAPRMSGNSYANSMDVVPLGREISAGQRYCSVNRVENTDFAITRKNNHFSAQDKLTRSDPFYMAPRAGLTNNSVKYDIISNERRWFKY